MQKFLLTAALLMPFAVAAQEKKAVIVPRYSQEQLARIRAALSNQMVVRDEAENSFRVPTGEEAAALHSGAATTGRVVTLRNGATALKSDPSSMEFLTVGRKDDGTLTFGHSPARSSATKEKAHAK